MDIDIVWLDLPLGLTTFIQPSTAYLYVCLRIIELAL